MLAEVVIIATRFSSSDLGVSMSEIGSDYGRVERVPVLLPQTDDMPKLDGLLLVPDTRHLAHANFAYVPYWCSSVTR